MRARESRGTGIAWLLVAATTIIGLAGAGGFIALWFNNALETPELPGLRIDIGPTIWLLPAITIGMHAAGAATLGCLTASAFLLPGMQAADRLLIAPAGYRLQRIAVWAAGLWALGALVALVLTTSELLGISPSAAWDSRLLLETARSTDQGKALCATAALALLAGVIARLTHTVTGAALGCMVAIAGCTPVAFAGHSAGAGNHQLAVSAQLLHVVPAALWVGGIAAILLQRGADPADRTRMVRRFSTLAGCCFIAVTTSGTISAIPRVASWSDLITTPYGTVLAFKATLLVCVGVLGWAHRTHTMPALADGQPGTFIRIALAEIALLAIAVGLAVGLSRSAAPKVTADEDIATSLLGYPMPAPISVQRLATEWLVDPLVCAVVLVGVVGYLAGVWRLRARGVQWPMARTVAWVAGCLMIIVVTNSGVGRYAPVLLSVHMGQHLVLTMLAPIALVLSAPVTLGFRALRPTNDPRLRGPREWLMLFVHSGFTRMMAHPLMALGMYGVGLYAMYFTGLHELALRSHAAHLAMIFHFVMSGYLFFWSLIGIDPAPKPVPYAGRIPLLFGAITFHAIFGLAIMQSDRLFAEQWYTTLPRPWGADPLSDQHTAGGIAWTFGEIPAALVLGVIVVQWMRADEREQRRVDRTLDAAFPNVDYSAASAHTDVADESTRPTQADSQEQSTPAQSDPDQTPISPMVRS